jgi:alkanesulfonate monooxygenase SsuD/methylene tetrahydromethanopterin reductase-like flavin-dependent oxidoreductase (luciferase family)
VILGIGSGHAKPEFRTLGADYEGRGPLTDESIRAIRAAWSEEVASFSGERVRFRDVMVSPRPSRPGGPPIWVGGNGKPALRRAATLGEGWIPWKLAVEEFAAAVHAGERLRSEAGRSGSFDWVAPLHVGIDADAASVPSEIDQWRKAGATAFHVGVEARSQGEFLARIEWLAGVLQRGT